MSKDLRERVDRYLAARQRVEEWDREIAAAEALVDEALADDDIDIDDEDGEDLGDDMPLSAEDLAALAADDEDDDEDGDGQAERSYASMRSELDHAAHDLHAALGGKPVCVSRGFRRPDVALIPRMDGSIETVELHRL